MVDDKNDQSNTTSLPLDILIILMDYVRPLDLIAFRKVCLRFTSILLILSSMNPQTCRALYHASHRRSVWIKALTNLNRNNGIFLPTFQLDQLTTQELTQVVTAPVIWLTTIRERYRQQQEQPHRDLTWKPWIVNPNPIELGLEVEDEFQALFLVPGGRFVVLLTIFSLQIWDLGLVGKGSVPHRVTWVRMSQQGNIAFSTQPTKDSLGLRLAVSSYPMDTNQ